MNSKGKVIEKIEKDLLIALLDYVVPLLSKKTPKKPLNGKKGLEDIVQNTKPKIGFSDIKDIGELLARNPSNNVKARHSSVISSNNLVYSIAFSRKKESAKAGNYSITISYEENRSRTRLKIKTEKDGKPYASEIIDDKEAKDRVIPYKVTITYEDRYGEERLTITYQQQMKNYLKKHVNDKEDMTNRVPLKWLNILPESMMGGILGFTYIGDPAMGRRADLTGKTARMVDIHESIHTPDEYETRILTSWIMDKTKGKYTK